MSDCPRCKQRGKDWIGDDPKCAFKKGVFSGDNWNCATMNALRALCKDEMTVCNEDQNVCVLPYPDFGHIVLEWYKSRGRTEGAWMLHGKDKPTKLTLEEAEFLLNWENQP